MAEQLSPDERCIAEQIRCDVCGRFIGLQALLDGRATVRQVTPDSHLSKEEMEILCEAHTK